MGCYALILNASFEPLNIVDWQRAIQLVFQNKVEVLEEHEQEVRSVSLTMKMPTVLKLHQYISLAHTKSFVRFSRLNVFLRDHFQCQYCAETFDLNRLTLDHVIPSVQGGQKEWKNIVTACMECNQKKGGRTPQQANLTLVRFPKEPKFLPKSHVPFKMLDDWFSYWPDQWMVYLKAYSR